MIFLLANISWVNIFIMNFPYEKIATLPSAARNDNIIVEIATLLRSSQLQYYFMRLLKLYRI